MNDAAMTLDEVLEAVRDLHAAIRDRVVAATQRQAVEDLSAVDRDDDGDTIYAIDRVSEETLVEELTRRVASRVPIVLVAEGLAEGAVVLPRGASADEAVYRVIVDPIDGTRGVMFQKRSAWVLTGIAPNRGPGTSLRDIEAAVQTEIPLIKQHLADQFWTVKGGRVHGCRFNRSTGAETELSPRPSRAGSIEHGCVTFARFFPGARDELAAIDEEVTAALLGPSPSGKALCFEDQYACTGGQFYELMMGHDRVVADLRPLMRPILADRGQPTGLCCHPYDLCTWLIAEQAGVVLTNEIGQPLDAPLDVHADVAWVGYANPGLRHAFEPLLLDSLTRRGLVAARTPT